MSGPTPPRDQRVDAVIPVRFADAKEFLVEYTSNISLGGVFVRTASPSAFGTVVRLSLELPGTTQAVPVTGQVAFVLPADQAARQGKVPGMGVRFARLDQAVQETLAAYVEGLQRKSRGRVLLVDDDAVMSQQLADLLRSHHLNVTTVSNAIKALEILRFGGVDFICSDIVMPRMDGFEFRDNVRNNPKTADIPFVFLTASENPADTQLAAELGVQFFLRKPVEPGPLLALIRQVLGDAAFQPEAPGAAPPPAEEKIQRTKTQDRRIVEIAYRKFVALGLDTRFTADERGVYGQLQLKTVNIQDPATGNRLERAGLYSVGHDRVKPFWPRALGALPMFAFLDLPDSVALEKVVASAFLRRIDTVRQIKQTLDTYRIPNRYDAAGMRMLGQIKSGADSIVFSVRDSKTLFLESINGRSFGDIAQMRARRVDVSESKGGPDVVSALDAAYRRLQPSTPAAPGPPATAEPAPHPAPPPASAPASGGQWIGEPEDDAAASLAAAAVDLATKAAIAATVGAAAALPAPESAVRELVTEDIVAPLSGDLPVPVPELVTADIVAPVADEEPAPLEAAAAGDGDPAPAPAEAAAPPSADEIWPESAPSSGTEPFEAAPAGDAAPASPFADPPTAESPVDAADAVGMDDWSAYATPDVSEEPAPQSEPAPGESSPPIDGVDEEPAPLAAQEPVEPESPEPEGAFRGAEYELGSANGGGASADLELADPPPTTPSPAVSVLTDLASLNDLESTVVPRSEPEPENLTPEEKQARDWADEWTGDVATAEPLWTIQPGEDAIKASMTVTDALGSPERLGEPTSAPPTAESAAAPTEAATDAGMTAMVCTLCASTYYIGDEIDDERLLLVCPSCIAKNLA